MERVVGALTPAQYWEWRESIEEMFHAKTKAELSACKLSLMEKDIEISKLRSIIYKETVKAHGKLREDSAKRYEMLRARLEGELGYSLADKVIDELTFEVKEEPKTDSK